MPLYPTAFSVCLMASALLYTASAQASAFVSYSIQWGFGFESAFTGPPPSALSLSPPDQKMFSISEQATDFGGNQDLAVSIVNTIKLTNTDPALTGQSVMLYGSVFSFEEARVSNMQTELASVYASVSSPNLFSPGGRPVSNQSCTTDQFGRQFSTPYTCITLTNLLPIFGSALIPAPGDETAILVTTSYGYHLEATAIPEPSSIIVLYAFIVSGVMLLRAGVVRTMHNWRVDEPAEGTPVPSVSGFIKRRAPRSASLRPT